MWIGMTFHLLRFRYMILNHLKIKETQMKKFSGLGTYCFANDS